MRGTSSRRASRRAAATERPAQSDVIRTLQSRRRPDPAAVATAVARAAAASRAHGDASIAIASVLDGTLTELTAGVGIVIDEHGAPIASASASAQGLAEGAKQRKALINAGKATIARNTESINSGIVTLPLRRDGAVIGAVALCLDTSTDREIILSAARLLANCLADMLTADTPATPKQLVSNVADRLLDTLAGHSDGIALFGADGGLVTANKAFAEAHGADSKELKGLTLEQILQRCHDGLGPLLLARDVSSTSGGIEMALAADGRWLRLSRRESANGDVLVLQSPADTTIAAAAETRRRIAAVEAEARARDIAWQGLQVGVILLSDTGRIAELNNQACQLLGSSQSALLNRKLGGMAKATADKWMLLRRPGAAGQALAVKAKGLNDGRTLLTLAEFPGDQPTSTPAPADVNQKVDPLASSEALGELGHEMRTPLNAVIGFTDVLLARSFGPLNDRQSQYLQDIGGAGRHMLEMVDNMLDHAKMVSGRFPFEAEWTSIPELIGEATRLLEPTAKLDGVRLIQHPSKPIEAFVDRRALLQALLNLLANAIKFTPEGGKVTLSAILDDEMFALMVADTGEGIPDSDLKLVTQPFTQARRLGGRPLKGAGLGLSIVSAVAKLHGGQIDISSTLGAGTIINIKMPADRARLLEEA